MLVSKRSWHYQLVLLFSNDSEDSIPSSLCCYFWSVLASIVYALFALVFILLIAVLVSTPITQLFFNIPLPLVILGGIICELVLIAFLVELVKYRRTKEGYYNNVKEDGLIVSYLKAKKNKFCPKINFID